MGELYNPFPKLPKNIRQIGERDQAVRLYMEDYVNTYLKRLYPKGGQDLRVGLLLGVSEEHDGTPYLFVDGAMEMEDVTVEEGQVAFTEAAWKKAYQLMEQMFPKRVVLGWFLCGAQGTELSPLNYWKQHGQYFAGKYQLMYLNGGQEGEEAVYVTAEDGFYKLRGHSIYYERNQMMQDYMIHRKDVRRVESGAGDTVIRDFRQRMEENKKQVDSRRSAIRVLGSLCSLLTIMVLAGGVAMFNNYEKMKDMEAVLASALPDRLSGDEKETEANSFTIEEVKGNLEQYRETMASEETVRAEESSGESEAVEGGNATAEETYTYPKETETADEEETTEAETEVQISADPANTYTVQDGETLYGICLKLYGTGSLMEDICRLNGLDDENKIISGQNLLLP